MVVLGLHGAMVAQGYLDCEGDILSRIREIVGPRVVVGVELDPHCHLSEAMISNSDLLICFKEYPHTDVAERAFELVDLCAAQVQGKVFAVPSMVDCEMFVTLHTTRQPVRGFVDRIQRLEGEDGILSISIAHGFAWGDTPDMGTKVLVYTNGNKSAGDLLARKLADELIEMREQLQARYPDVDAALDQAMSIQQGLVVLADSADNPGGGAAGDSTFILRRVLDRGIAPVALGPLWDPIAVRIAFDAGIGAKLPMRVGGKTGPMSGDPIDAVWEVLALERNMQMSSLSGAAIGLGDCACIRTDGVSVVLTSLRNQALSTDIFTQLGCELGDQRIVVVKSSQHFYAAFAPFASAVIYVSAPGSVPIDLSTLEYKNVRLPKWPFK
jgi:microcystin degradation protein MlrC